MSEHPQLHSDPSAPGTPGTANGSSKELVPNRAGEAPVPKKSNRKFILLAAVAALIVVFLAVFLPIYFTIIRKKDSGSSSSGTSGGATTGEEDAASTPGAPAPTASKLPTTGGDGSIVTMANGTTFTYKNAFGGFWVHDPEDPNNLNAQPNSWTPPLNQSWDWARNRINGVNVGGLFVLEPFISPAIFQKYPGTEDEWELSEAIMATNGNLNELEEHYRTFITEQDLAEIAGAGLNWIRLPIGWWAIETTDGEPFLERTSWNYFLQVIEWARKYGLRVLIDLHSVPGSQNGLNHSGRLGSIQWLAGDQGVFNAERTLYYLRVLTEYLSQPQYKEVVKVIGLVNEPRAATLGHDPLSSFYLRAYDMLREITGFGEGNGPYIAVQEGMQSMRLWEDLLPGGDRVVIDGHSYFVFNGANPSPIVADAEDGLPGGTWPGQACSVWGPEYNASRNTIGPTVCGEFSAAPNDCALFINGVGEGSTGHPQCPEYQDWENYNSTMKAGISNWVMASFDAFGDWFFWTWKIGPSIAGRVEAPLWSYKLGLEQGWMPTDPRQAVGKCLGLGVTRVEWSGTFEPARTGGVPSPTIPAAYSAQFPWPPVTMSDVAGSPSDLPRFPTPTPMITMPSPSPTSTST